MVGSAANSPSAPREPDIYVIKVTLGLQVPQWRQTQFE